jgi:hypothetical protein
MWLQNNSSHIFRFSVCKTLNEHSVGCYTGHASTSPTPLYWPSLSPDLTIRTTLYTALWMNKWLCTVVTIMSCTVIQNRLRKSHKCFSTDHISHDSALWCVWSTGTHTNPLAGTATLSNVQVECSEVKQDDSGFLGTFYMTSPLIFICPLSLFTI